MGGREAEKGEPRRVGAMCPKSVVYQCENGIMSPYIVSVFKKLKKKGGGGEKSQI